MGNAELVGARPRVVLAEAGTDRVRPMSSAELATLEERFRAFAKASAQFRNEVLESTGLTVEGGSPANAQANLEIARTVFSKWTLETMVALYTQRTAGFAELRRLLPGISSRVLSHRLRALEGLGFVARTVLGSRPPRVAYVLTHEGHTVSRLGEPVFLYLRTRRAYGLGKADDASRSTSPVAAIPSRTEGLSGKGGHSPRRRVPA